ncbi:type II toxin-antitoxin system PemK/MazF family toxin [Microlunatus parietis]|uniref:mRNA interferase MazF n=1 Tax=Microlunatus parietis TaxID=682979 RepID=A0A7Y9LFQ3_9ACTN|nr:type II toxin-antitoxin system PemK/MazF family toxin [Microlunatus parietis]NYE74356.1 mRNA interferase MazF [Microlunatus parietis]
MGRLTRVRRGEIWTAAGPGYAGKPRPVVVIQSDLFDQTDSVTLCPLTSDPTDAPILRIPIDPTSSNGLRVKSRLMVDKVTTARRSQLRERIGVLEGEYLLALERALVVFIGLAS